LPCLNSLTLTGLIINIQIVSLTVNHFKTVGDGVGLTLTVCEQVKSKVNKRLES